MNLHLQFGHVVRKETPFSPLGPRLTRSGIELLEELGMTQVFNSIKRLLLAGLVSAFAAAALFAQVGGTSISGQVTDPSGASVPAATVTATGPGGATLETQTNEQGRYVFRHLAPGVYTVKIDVKGFVPFEKSGIQITAGGKSQAVDAQLTVAMAKEQVTVQSEGQQLSVSAENNASALVLKGDALKSLSEDPDELQQQLMELAGPAAGPNGGQIYIDGFTGGELPPKEAILEVRVNQNPFSAQYERLGYGRIDIITKPGYSKFHGGVFSFANNSAFNSRNPFVGEEPNYHSEFFSGDVGGPLGKKASFYFHVFHRKSIDSSIVDAVVLDQNFNQTPLNEAVRNRGNYTHYSPRFDFQLSSKNVLTVRADYRTNDGTNNGIGQFNLPSMAYDSSGHGAEVHLSDTQIVSDRTVTQTLFGYEHDYNSQNPFSVDPTVRVIGAFTGGGSSGGQSLDTTNHYEIRNTTSMTFGKHSLTYGGELRRREESVNQLNGFNGVFTFPSLTAYQITEQGLAQGLSAVEIQAAGGGASQFVITAGNPIASANVTDLALFAEDSWRVRRNVSLTYGFRFETQNQISDHADFAPRIGLAWGLGHGAAPKTVIRAGFGIFYDRFGESQVLQADQLNGINEQRFVVNQPSFFPDIPPVGTLATYATFPTIYRIDPNLRAPYTMEAAASIERQVTKNITTSVTYINSHGVHQLLTNNINAPFPGTYNPAEPSSGVRPFGDVGNIYQYESVGIFNENQVIANFSIRAGAALNLFGYYTLSYANSDTGGVSSFPMDPYDIRADYGPAAFAIRNRFFVGGSVAMPYGFQFSPFLVVTSGQPYDVTIGRDLNGDSIFNDRPALTAPAATGPNIVATQFGTFNIAPAPGQMVIPINYLIGPGQFSMNARVSKTFGFGKVTEGGGGFGDHHYHGHGGGLGGGGLTSNRGGDFWHHGGAEDHRYQIELGAMVHNVFNKVNLGTPVGSLGSPLFGQSTSLASGFFGGQSANRRINLFLRFNF
jgi:Carboxypeptidase regulatory-like domain